MLTIANSNPVSIASDSIISSHNKNKTIRIDANYIYVNSNSTIDKISLFWSRDSRLEFIKIILIDPTLCIPSLYLILKRLQIMFYHRLLKLMLLYQFLISKI
jgi:hypothetical protein